MLIENLYTIETFELKDTVVTAGITINPNHELFKGHFPGKPVMPGVCMIQIIKELTEKAVGQQLFLSVCSNIKFMAIINPETHPHLKLEIRLHRDGDTVKVKNTSFFDETVALKLSAVFTVLGADS